MKPRIRLRVVEPAAALPTPNTFRDFRAKPWIRGEGATFWTPERLAELAATNAAIRNERRKK